MIIIVTRRRRSGMYVTLISSGAARHLLA